MEGGIGLALLLGLGLIGLVGIGGGGDDVDDIDTGPIIDPTEGGTSTGTGGSMTMPPAPGGTGGPDGGPDGGSGPTPPMGPDGSSPGTPPPDPMMPNPMTPNPMQPTGADQLIIGTDNPEPLDGEDGNDTIRALGGDDTLIGGPGDDILRAGDGNDTATGDAGADLLFGDAGNDTLAGGDGNDLIVGGRGQDNLDGGAGDDVVAGYYAFDLPEGATRDSLPNFGDPSAVLASGLVIETSPNAGVIDGGSGNDTVIGGPGDTLIGGDGADSFIVSLDDFVEASADAPPPPVVLSDFQSGAEQVTVVVAAFDQATVNSIVQSGAVQVVPGDTAGTNVVRYVDPLDPLTSFDLMVVNGPFSLDQDLRVLGLA